MKKIILFISFLVLCIPCFVFGVINNNYSISSNYTADYIKMFDAYKLFIAGVDGTYVPYNYAGHGSLESASKFQYGGLLSNFEFNTSKYNNKSWLIDGQEYWTLTTQGSGKNYYIDRVGTGNTYKNHSDETGVKITEYILPHTKVTGKGSYSDPWVFIKPEFNITINLENATVAGTSNFSKTIYQYEAEYSVVPIDYYYEYQSHTCDGNANISFNPATGKLDLNNVLSNVTCSIKYKAKHFPVNIVLSNASANVTSLNIIYGENAEFTIDPNQGYVYRGASCTNSQTYSYTTHLFKVTNVTGPTTCTLDIAKVDSKTYAYLASDQTYTAPYAGYYDFDLYGARGGGYGGAGGKAWARIYLNAGDVITINTGGTNGYNGGGAGKYTGGGATTIKRNGTILVAAAGGGGGAEGTAGGNGTGAGGAKAHTSGSGTNGGAGSAGSNYSGGGSSYDYSNTYYDECLTGSNTCRGGNIETNCSSCHHREYECVGDYVETSTCQSYGTCDGGGGTGYNYYTCSGGRWSASGYTNNVVCGSGCTKGYSCGSAPSGSCTNGDTDTVTCDGWCDCTCCVRYEEVWDSCAYQSRVCVYDCDTVYDECATGSNTCSGGNVTETAAYKSGYGGSNYFNSTYTVASTSEFGKNTGDGYMSVAYFGEAL